MKFNEYMREAARTLKPQPIDRSYANLAMGLAGESGEVVDLLKKMLFHGKNVAPADLEEELGDVLWYIATLCHISGLSLEAVAYKNVQKLKARYPDGFSEERSNNRPSVVQRDLSR